MAVNRELLSACAPLREALHRTELHRRRPARDARLRRPRCARPRRAGAGAAGQPHRGRSRGTDEALPAWPTPARRPRSRTRCGRSIWTGPWRWACSSAPATRSGRRSTCGRSTSARATDGCSPTWTAAWVRGPRRPTTCSVSGTRRCRCCAPPRPPRPGRCSTWVPAAASRRCTPPAYARSVTATDINLRALDLSAATFALNEIDVELLGGPWFEPVAGRRFDRVVANPPFVVGRGRVEHTYRDSGLDLDGASELMVSQRARPPRAGRHRRRCWRPGCTCAARTGGRGSRPGCPRTASTPGSCSATSPTPRCTSARGCATRGLDPRDPATAAQAEAWLAHFEAADVEGIGFGFVYLRAHRRAAATCSPRTCGTASPTRSAARRSAISTGSAWLRERDVLEQRFTARARRPPSSGCRCRARRAGSRSWPGCTAATDRTGSTRWTTSTAALLGGMRPDGLALNELLELLAGRDTARIPTSSPPPPSRWCTRWFGTGWCCPRSSRGQSRPVPPARLLSNFSGPPARKCRSEGIPWITARELCTVASALSHMRHHR